MSRKLYTTVGVAKAADVPRATLQFWIKTGKISAPEIQLVAGRAVRLWSEAQIVKVRKLKGTLGPGAKKKARAGRRSQSC